jgi:hypothetical protein
MANKRMFSKDVVRTDRFLDMSLSAQALYFHLCMDADARGFVSPKSIMRMINASQGDLSMLAQRGFVIPFESGVLVITHWCVNNNIREDREASSQFVEEYDRLCLSEVGYYQLQENSRSTPAQIRLREIRLNEDKREGDSPTPKSFGKKSDITDSVLEEISQNYEIPIEFVKDCWDSAQNWCEAKGKIQKNYRAFLSNWVKRERAMLVMKSRSNSYSKRGGVYDARTK